MLSAEGPLAGIFESAMDGIVAIDADQRILMVNRAAEQMFGWTRTALLGKPVDVLVPIRLRDEHRLHVERFARTGVTSRRMGAQMALSALHANGHEFPIEASISQHGEGPARVLAVILRDVSARLHGEAMLASSEARMRGILDSAMDAIITVDDEQRVVAFNSAAEAMFGWQRGEALGQPLGAFIPHRFREDHGQHVRRFGESATSSRRMAGARVVTGMRRNGEEFPIDASISQLMQNGRRFYTVILRDISELARTEAALRRSREELKELATAASSAREQEKSRIARELHDELAQALTALKMDISLVRHDQRNPEPELLSRLEKMNQQVDLTIAAMRRIAADLRPLTLDDLGLAAAVESLVEQFTKKTGVACELALSRSEIEMPPECATAVFRIVQEGLTNIARHAKARHAEVAIDATPVDVSISITDDGVGFVPDSPRQNAYGLLGLRERAYLLGGEVEIRSSPGGGTRIDVRLPLSPAEATS